MVDYYDHDEAMKDDPGSYEDVGEADVELAERDRIARDNYDIKLFMVKSRVLHKPSLDTLYFNQSEALMSHIPDDLQLPVLLSQYDKVGHLTNSDPFQLC
jgi:hypothetical protein